MRARLVAVALAVTAMVVLAFLIPLAGLVRELARSRALNGAERDAQLVARLVTLVSDQDDLGPALASVGVSDLINGHPLTVIEPDGTVFGAELPPGEDLSGPRSGSAGSGSVEGGTAVYVPVVTGTGTAVVRVFVPRDELRENVARSWAVLGALGAGLILLGVFAADRLGRSLVKPVQELSSAAAKLGKGDLATRVDPSGPDELVDVGRRFNELAGRVAELLQIERETAADLSHRLRTPLTAARLDVEALPPGPERDRLDEDLDVLERTIDHIIDQARRSTRKRELAVSDLRAVVSSRAAFWEALAEEQGRTARLLLPDDETPIHVKASASDLEAALDALLGNVFAHTPESTEYRVSLSRADGRALVVIADAGPGLPGEIVFERGRSAAGSTGLGLDIARRTAEAAGGSLTADRGELGGAAIVLDLPVTTT